jgi:ElaB/YqjD/DUF883 family membrane-anchored ribosome-binding protein
MLVALLAASGCTSLYYSAMEKLGKEKRDILLQRILDSKKEQTAARKQIQNTLKTFQDLAGYEGGDLERSYNKLNDEYERARSDADKLKDRVKSIDQVGNDLFREWQKEIDQMKNQNLKSRSRALLREARQRHSVYVRKMSRTVQKMNPILQSFHDQVLFLKHNLNARAVGSLKQTAASINAAVDDWMKDLDSSLQEADTVIETLKSSET